MLATIQVVEKLNLATIEVVERHIKFFSQTLLVGYISFRVRYVHSQG